MRPALSRGYGFPPRKMRPPAFFTPPPPPASVCRSSIPGKPSRGVRSFLPYTLISQGRSSASGPTGRESWDPNPLHPNLPVGRDFVPGEASSAQATPSLSNCLASKGVILREGLPSLSQALELWHRDFCPTGETSHKNGEL